MTHCERPYKWYIPEVRISRMDDLGDKMFYSMKFHEQYINTSAKKTKCLLKVLLLLPATNNVSDVNSIKQCTCTNILLYNEN